MSGHTYTHTYTQDNYSNPRCACAPRVNNNYCAHYATKVAHGAGGGISMRHLRRARRAKCVNYFPCNASIFSEQQE